MTDCAQCGDCCTNFPLNTPERADVYGRRVLSEWPGKVSGSMRKMAVWMSNLVPIAGPTFAVYEDGKPPQPRWRYRCPLFDEQTRLCTDHTNRPAVCSRFPFYDREPKESDRDWLSPRCSFLADVPGVKMLPIAEVRNGPGALVGVAGSQRHSDVG